MNIHEFGADKNKIIVLIHPSLVMWDYFEYILSILKEEYHIIVPALPGYMMRKIQTKRARVRRRVPQLPLPVAAAGVGIAVGVGVGAWALLASRRAA